MRRITSDEILDLGLAKPEDLRISFDDIWRINRRFGGVDGMLQLLEQVLAQMGLRAARVLDVGGGDGRMAARLRDELGRRGVKANFVVLDRKIDHLRLGSCARDAPPAVAADVLHPPFGGANFDIVMCNLFLHHFSGEAALGLLTTMLAMARCAAVVNDLERRRIAYWVIRYIPWLTHSKVARLDGAASVRQAYTPAEITELARQTGASNFEVTKLPFMRTGLILWK